MGKDIGPKYKLSRQFGEKLDDAESSKNPVVKRPYPPGQHGPKKMRRVSEYGQQLREKQKAKKLYGMREKQFRNYFKKAKKMKGAAGENLVALLETRLDNVLFRLGFSKTRRSARQAINHGHVRVNNKKVTIPSYHVKIGEMISIRPKSLQKILFKDVPKSISKKNLPSWLFTTDKAKLQSKVASLPAKEELEQGFDTSMIIEFYSR